MPDSTIQDIITQQVEDQARSEREFHEALETSRNNHTETIAAIKQARMAPKLDKDTSRDFQAVIGLMSTNPRIIKPLLIHGRGLVDKVNEAINDALGLTDPEDPTRID